MNLLLRINLALGAVIALGAVAAGFICWSILEANARREVLAQAGLMMDSALAIRAYTANEVVPLLDGQMSREFLPQSVPFYAATQNFLTLRQGHPEYSYAEATLNPTNPRDRATDWEADIIQRFRDDSSVRESVGERVTPMGPMLFLARPIRAEAGCLACHSLSTTAPATMIARYGSSNGFGWRLDEVVGAQVVSVPLASAAASAQRAFRAFMASLIGIFAAILLVINTVMYFLIVRPVRRMGRIADQLSLGDLSAPAFPVGGAREISALARSFNRMRVSLDKALKLLEQ
jgi:protein-histidine pros-kinase